MNINYLDNAKDIIRKKSYLNAIDTYFEQNVYSMKLDEEIDIFSELPSELFLENSKKQMADVMKVFKKEYIRYINRKEIHTILPKLKYHMDEEGASVIQLASTWSEGNASLYFAFERDESESSFGMVWNDNARKNFESRSGSIILNNIDDIIHEILEFIFRVY